MSEEFGTDVGAAERMVREWQERASEKAERFGRMQTEIQEITVTESSEDGAVRVTVGSNGILRDLRLTDGAGNRPMPKLSAEIMRAVRTAQSRIPELMREAAAATVGTEDSAVQHVLDQARRNFPEPVAEEVRHSGVREMNLAPDDEAEPAAEPTGAAPSRPEPEESDEDDFGDRSFLH